MDWIVEIHQVEMVGIRMDTPALIAVIRMEAVALKAVAEVHHSIGAPLCREGTVTNTTAI